MDQNAGTVGQNLPEKHELGDELDFNGAQVSVRLHVELPFWLLVDNCTINVSCGSKPFTVDVRDDWAETHLGVVSDTRYQLVHLGPAGVGPPAALRDKAEQSGQVLASRPCKTILTIVSCCSAAAIDAAADRGPHTSVARQYLRDYCSAHIPVVNTIIRGYRLATFDPFAYDVSPWDIPFWLLDVEGVSDVLIIVPYLESDRRPEMHEANGTVQPHALIAASELPGALNLRPSPGELEVLDAENLMVRGDYSGAVRRIATALEVALEAALRRALEPTLSGRDLEREVAKHGMNFYARLEQYEMASGRTLDGALRDMVQKTRTLRKAIVHRGYRLGQEERGRAQMAVDTGRWAFNWLEQEPARTEARERSILRRSLGRDLRLFNVVVCAAPEEPAGRDDEA